MNSIIHENRNKTQKNGCHGNTGTTKTKFKLRENQQKNLPRNGKGRKYLVAIFRESVHFLMCPPMAC
jgi:hypothetical protein